MKSFLAFFVLACGLVASYTVHAQVPGADASKGTGRITGVVTDSTNKQPVSFATVALVSIATKKPIDGAVADDKGKFTLSKVPTGEYQLVVSFIGYRSLTLKLPTVAERGTDLNTGTLWLTPEVQKLKEVTVTAQANIIEEKVDRTVYNAELDQTARGGDAADVLRRVPMLSVDLSGNVSLRGNSNLTVLINGKPSTLMAGGVADALKQIPSDMIKSVEVITSPSAKYDAEGSGGIINIITKKNTLQGLSLGINTDVGIRGSNLGLNGSYRKGKMGFSLGGFGRSNYNVTGNFENDQTTFNNDGSTSVRSVQRASTLNQGLFGRYTLGWDYDISKYNSLNASVQFGVRNDRNFQNDLLTQTFRSDTSFSNLQDVTVKNLSNNVDATLTYTRTFEKAQKEFSVAGQYSRNTRTNDFLRNSLTTGFPTTKNINDSYNQEITIQADYQTPIAENQLFEIGAKNIARRVFSDFQTFFARGSDGALVPSLNARLNNALTYDQNVTAGYFSYTLTTTKKYSFKIGSRYEYTTIQARSASNETFQIPSYGVLVPSVNLSKRLKNGNMVKLAYNRRIQRPSLQFLNPNIQAANPLNVTVGNPSLEPEFTNNFELSYNTTVKGSNLSVSTFARNSNNAIQSVRQPIGRGDTVQTTFQNIGSENAYGFSLFMNINVNNKLSLNGGGDFFYAVLRNNVPDPLFNAANQGWVPSFRMFGSYTLTKGWALQLFSFYRARQVQLQGFQGGFGIYSLSLRKEFKNKKGGIGFGAENFFTPRFRIPSEVVSPLINQRSVNELHNMNFKVTFSYRIGKITMENTPRRRRGVNNDDLKEGGDNGGNDGGGGMGGGGGAGGGQRGGAPQRPAGGQNPAGQRPGGGQQPGGQQWQGRPAGQRPDSTQRQQRPDSTQAQPWAKPTEGRRDSLQTAPPTVPPARDSV
ncbi:MAG: TonB-dependent receptor, partial [Cytophagales bacterium]|nr:TonB-dependent receptor [Cytophagales bacterium]